MDYSSKPKCGCGCIPKSNWLHDSGIDWNVKGLLRTIDDEIVVLARKVQSAVKFHCALDRQL